MKYEVPIFLHESETAFNAAMVSNDSACIAGCVTDDWITDIYQKTDNGWKCVLTHLTPAKEI